MNQVPPNTRKRASSNGSLSNLLRSTIPRIVENKNAKTTEEILTTINANRSKSSKPSETKSHINDLSVDKLIIQ